jgi:AmmeMemoRadiSam system protein B
MQNRVRETAVAGMFYPADPKELEDQLKMMIPREDTREEVLGIISPHAGFVYSGSAAGLAYGGAKIPDSVVIMGVAHGPIMEEFGIEDAVSWETPLGQVPVDVDMAAKILEEGNGLFALRSGINSREHSIEVQVPFLRYLNPEVRILPVLVSTHDMSRIKEAGRVLADVLGGSGVLMVASTDMSHYVSVKEAEEKDSLAINEIKALNPEGLMEVVIRHRISMCGVAPTALLLTAARELGATGSHLVCYTHSGKVSGDLDQVVSYASFTVS